MYFGRKTGKFVRMFGQWKYENSQRKMLRNKTDSNSSDNDVRSLLLFQNKPLQILSYTLHCWQPALKKCLQNALVFPIFYIFALLFYKSEEALPDVLRISQQHLWGGILCPALQKNRQNKPQKLSRFQNPLIPAHITWQKTRSLSLLPKKPPINHQETREKH